MKQFLNGCLHQIFLFSMRNLPLIRSKNERDWDILMLLVLICLLIAAYLTHDRNFAYGVGSLTRALYVDEGFYSDAAQNLIKLGQWDMLHDSRHWPGSPMTAILQSIVFSFFGISIEVARMLGAVLVALGAWALYSIARTQFHPGVAVLLVVSSISTMTFFAIARAAVTDPMAMVMFLVGVWAFVRIPNRSLAIPLSLSFAYLAFLSKMYFIFAPATMITLWLGELLLLPRLFDREINRALLKRLVLSIAGIFLVYLSYRIYFNAEISNFLAINANKKPVFELDRILQSMKFSIRFIPRNTQAVVFLDTLFLSVGYLLARYFVVRYASSRGRVSVLLTSLSKISRAEWAMGIFLISGLLTVGSLRLLKTHYHFFSIIPFAFLAIAMVYHVFPRRLAAYLSVAILLAHMVYQLPAYREWWSRPQPRSIDTISRDIAAQLHAEYPTGLIPVVGEFSAQLGLFSERIISIDAKWVSRAQLCARLNYWKPPYHVNVVWNNSSTRKMVEKIATCPSIQVGVPVYHRSLPLKNDFIALTRLHYEEKPELPIAPTLLLLR